jgi:hypothetical protein
MIASLLSQTRRPDVILVNLPPRFDRTGEKYPPDELLPDWLVKDSIIKINRCDRDWGPATKLVPTVMQLHQWKQPSIIITVDDDIRYLPRTVFYLEQATMPCVVGASQCEVWCADGLDFVNSQLTPIGEHGRCCNVAQGWAGVAYPGCAFDFDFYPYMEWAMEDIDMRFYDDIMISNYLARRNINRRVLAYPEYSSEELRRLGCILEYGNKSDALRHGAGSPPNNVVRGQRVLKKLALNNKLWVTR